jgi:NAD+ kinase
MQTLLSPNGEVFSTPPTSPNPNYAGSTTWDPLPLALSRRNSRPSTLQIDHSSTEWKPDVELETTSPLNHKTTLVRDNGNQLAHQSHPEAASKPLPPPTRQPQMKSMKSPCFVHSHLDRASDWLRSKAMQGELGVAKSLQRKTDPKEIQYDVKPSTNEYSGHAFGNTAIPESLLGGDIDDDDDFGGSLTKQLADTAVGVRELSKQLGR